MQYKTSWEYVSHYMSCLPYGTERTVNKSEIAHPLDGGARVSIGLPKGQIKDYRITLLPDKSCLHIQEYGSFYSVHIDQKDPKYYPIEHLQKDAPDFYVTSSVLAGAIAGARFGGFPGLILGGFFGGIVGIGTSNFNPQPQSRYSYLN